MEGLNKLAKEIHKRNVEKGFWDDYDNPKKMAANLALVHSEVSEALECDRKAKYYNTKYEYNKDLAVITSDQNNNWFKEKFEQRVKDTFEDELADIIIRVLDLAAFKNVDIQAHIEAKMRYNALRPHKHGKKY